MSISFHNQCVYCLCQFSGSKNNTRFVEMKFHVTKRSKNIFTCADQLRGGKFVRCLT